MNPRRLYRSRDRQLAGVAGGMAEYLDIDPTIVRILWIVVGIVTGGMALIAYILLALVIPQSPYAAAGAPGGWAPAAGAAPGASGWTAPPTAPAWTAAPAPGAWAPAAAPARVDRGLGVGAIVGVVLIVFGAIALADAAIPGWVAGAILGPAVILALGGALLVSSVRRRDDAPAAATAVHEPATTPHEPAPFPAPAPAPWDGTDTQPVDPAVATEAAENPGTQGAQPA